VHGWPTKFERMIFEPCSNRLEGSPAAGLAISAGALGAVAAAAGCLGATTGRLPLMPRPRLRMPLPRGLADMISRRTSALVGRGGARIPSRDWSRADIMADRGMGGGRCCRDGRGAVRQGAGCEARTCLGAVDEREKKNRRLAGEMPTGLGETALRQLRRLEIAP
jgi:hypothetical protein